ncbi:hypothetical protein P153DRAFT_343834 [Dothidotthia symphoricarpi CBS 119687]|uniref:P-loop containing nucleoside triphosphate hydrolase protein n=1 Tax=Dothidotthia symphoricarpi CBS 119687 TaxID=1392245 RepID=A0A6A6A728_9PLEO|nr:uncharacterized protein P153DRAFT_343834 [Dothidotthia symphoricarpi CBS 119687]KAF2127620.1 hypothetical protein P153DRAFT_343834 [Dothidotthia symphoricarpi CBS 119687]
MAHQRLIDINERERKLPMRILVLGMCRTGTTSISTALRKLGYTPHQMRSVLTNPEELALWQEAINTTLLPPADRPRNLAPYGRSEFDKLLANYDVVTDIPGAMFAKELIEAYPEAKVILTNRKYKDWEHSMRESIWCLDEWHLFILCRILNITQMAPLIRLVHSLFEVHNGNNYGDPVARAAYEKHYNTVRSLVASSQLLEIDSDDSESGWESGWEPLCEFLGKEVPDEEFPRFNEDGAMRGSLDKAWWRMVQYVVLMVLLPGLVTLAGALLYFFADEVREVRDRWVLGPLKEFSEL